MLMQTWQPGLLVSVNPKARSNISSSSSVASSSIFLKSSSEKMRWQVEHARVPSQAPKPSMSTSLLITTSNRLSPSLACTVCFSPLPNWYVTVYIGLLKNILLLLNHLLLLYRIPLLNLALLSTNLGTDFVIMEASDDMLLKMRLTSIGGRKKLFFIQRSEYSISRDLL